MNEKKEEEGKRTKEGELLLLTMQENKHTHILAYNSGAAKKEEKSNKKILMSGISTLKMNPMRFFIPLHHVRTSAAL